MTRPSLAPLEPGERQLADFRPDRGRYWRDHAVMAGVLTLLALVVLWLIEAPWPAIGALGALAAVGVRAAYLASETLSLRWVLTDRRVLLPGGGAVPLLELAQVRTILGDVQLITRSGDKHLLKHLADGAGVVARITEAAERRAKRRAED